MISFVSDNKFNIPDRGDVFAVKLDRDSDDVNYLKNKIIQIDGIEYKCISVETFRFEFRKGLTHHKGDPVGLLVKPVKKVLK